MSDKDKICYSFQAGNCTRGNRCKYSHGPGANSTPQRTRGGGRGRGSADSSSPRGGYSATRGDRGGRGGRRGGGADIGASAPLKEALRLLRTPDLIHSQYISLFTCLLEVLDAGNPGMTQDVIRTFASEEGLLHIKKLAEAEYVVDRAPQLREYGFWKHGVLFLKALSHEEVCSSLVLESAVGTMYNVLYGISAARAIPLFQRVAAAMQARSRGADVGHVTDEYFVVALTAAARTLYLTLNINQSAAIQPELKAVAETLTEVYTALPPDPSDYSHQLAAAELNKVKQKLQLGDLIPTVKPATTAAASSTENTFYIDTDLPGEASLFGPRHDNDKRHITEIAILPTADEMFSPDTRPEYLPLRDPSAPSHHLPPGPMRLIDAQFRMLREDNSGQLRDAVKLILASWKDRTHPPAQLAKGAAQTATIIFTDIVIEGMEFTERTGLLIDVSFAQPRAVTQRLRNAQERVMWWTRSRYLQPGSLLCLVNRDQCIFFVVESRVVSSSSATGVEQKERNRIREHSGYSALDLAGDPDRALITLRLADVGKDHRVLVHNYLQARRRHLRNDDLRKHGVQFLVEFPGLLFNSFDPILRCLKSLMTNDIPFSRWLAPSTDAVHDSVVDENGKCVLKLPPPRYMLRHITLDLSCLRRDEYKEIDLSQILRHSINQPCSVESLQRFTTLDRGQCHALIAGLTKELALIQGPPGTGKSFVGVKLAKVLLENRKKLDIGPIVCVCYTNHALDQFLVDLLKDGATQIIRLGSRSKAPELDNLTLREKAREVDTTFMERTSARDTREELEHLTNTMHGRVLPGLARLATAVALRDYLEENHPRIHAQLFGSDQPDAGGWRTKQKKVPPNQAIVKWLDLSHLKPPAHLLDHDNARELDYLKPITDMRLLRKSERYRLLHHWEKEMQASTLREFSNGIRDFEGSKNTLKHVYGERDKRCLQAAHVIGVTTTGLASHAELLRSIKARVLVCEEAGEVLEAHNLVALLPSVTHAILIGDHQQLRPHIANHSLSMESRMGEKYRLDESVFERLTNETFVGPGKEQLPFPIVTLDTQRRMHPSIASLVRETLYPNLIDHDNTYDHPPVRGMARRLFWFDHEHLETNADQSDPTAMSKTNMFEVEMTAALVKHLFRQGHYKSKSIAVLTPYLGQMMKLRDRLGKMFEIVIGDKDQDELDAQDLEANVTEIVKEAGEVSKKDVKATVAKKATLLSELRLATVDNFQGEEAEVIVISLVRSNNQQRVGFLKTSNRINVLLSRAKHGMYIIGNASTARSVPMWSDVQTLLANDNNLGPDLQLCCDRHPDKLINVRCAEDFLRFSPEGGCEQRCGQMLPDCGHTCRVQCHSAMMHAAVVCNERCHRGLVGCEHPCVTPCGLPCKPCVVLIPTVPLPCGHISRDVKCHLAQHPEKMLCRHPVLKTLARCGHKKSVACFVDVNDENFHCSEECGAPLACGHTCKAACCKNRGIVEHPPCQTPCGRAFHACGHSCTRPCHATAGDDCGLCEAKCESRCAHATCPKKCFEPCTPCAESCVQRCPHNGACEMPCAVPCSVLPCAKRCEQLLPDCGHRCPGLCGEPCPSSRFCQICADDSVKDTVVDFLMYETYSETNLDENPMVFLPCGHFFGMETLDGQVSFDKVYARIGQELRPKPQGEWDTVIEPNQLRCITCRGPLGHVGRYVRISKALFMQQCVKRFISSAVSRWCELEQRVAAFEKHCNDNPPHKLTETAKELETSRYRPFIQGLTFISQFERSIVKQEEPYHRIRALVLDSIRRQRAVADENSAAFIAEDTTIASRQRALASTLHLRATWALVVDIFKASETKQLESLRAELSLSQKVTAGLMSARELLEQTRPNSANAFPRYEVEARVYDAKFTALFLQLEPVETRPDKIADNIAHREKLVKAATASLERARARCVEFPGSTAGLAASIDEAQKLLLGAKVASPVTPEEQRMVFEAMRQELGGSGTGHWYYCPNRHLFTIGECGMAMQLARCPQCDAPIGGQNHQAVQGVTRAEDFELQNAGHARREGLVAGFARLGL